MHVGDQINVFCHGSLGMKHQTSEMLEDSFHQSVLAGTVNGSILLFGQLSKPIFKILQELQTRLAKYLLKFTAGDYIYKNKILFYILFFYFVLINNRQDTLR
jgi:hypothetical protein